MTILISKDLKTLPVQPCFVIFLFPLAGYGDLLMHKESC